MATVRCVSAFPVLILLCVDLSNCALSDSEWLPRMNGLMGEERFSKDSYSGNSGDRKWKSSLSEQETISTRRSKQMHAPSQNVNVPGQRPSSLDQELEKFSSATDKNPEFRAKPTLFPNSFRKQGKFRSPAAKKGDLATESPIQVQGSLQATPSPLVTFRSNSSASRQTDSSNVKKKQTKDGSKKRLKSKKNNILRFDNRKSLTTQVPQTTNRSESALRSPKCLILVPPLVTECPEGHAIDQDGKCREIFS